MKEYVGIKRISAEPMNRGDYNKYRGWIIPENENPEDEGYLVKYPDNYESWSPKNAFEEAYTELGSNTLIDSVLLMKSKDFKERFKAEHIQLKYRLNKLKLMVNNWNNLSFIPTCSKDVYDEQIKYMQGYLNVLNNRSEIEHIDVD